MHHSKKPDKIFEKSISNGCLNSTDLWDKLTACQQQSVKSAQSELLAGMGKWHEEVMKKYEKYN